MRLFLSLLVFSALPRWSNAQKPRIAMATVAEGTAHLLSGDSLRLTCDVPEDQSPLWTFSWFFNGRPLVLGKSYTFWEARVLQSGNYSCMGTRESELSPTGFLETQLSPPVHVDVDGGWVILEAPDKAIIEETIFLKCRLRGQRLPKEVIFYFNGREIRRQPYTTLIVSNITQEDGGEYSCRATWEVQGLYHSAESTGVRVTVLEILATPQLHAHITPVDKRRMDLKMTCLTEINSREPTDREIYYYFLKDGKALGPASSRHTFTIPRVSPKNSARYSCKASVPSLNRVSWGPEVQVDIPRSL